MEALQQTEDVLLVSNVPDLLRTLLDYLDVMILREEGKESNPKSQEVLYIITFLLSHFMYLGQEVDCLFEDQNFMIVQKVFLISESPRLLTQFFYYYSNMILELRE